MRKDLLDKIRQAYPMFMADVTDIKLAVLPSGDYFATLYKRNIMALRYVKFTSVDDFKRICAVEEAALRVELA